MVKSEVDSVVDSEVDSVMYTELLEILNENVASNQKGSFEPKTTLQEHQRSMYEYKTKAGLETERKPDVTT